MELTDEQMKWRNKIPTNYRGNYEKAVTTNRKSEAIKAKCLDCMCWQKGEIKDCLIVYCPLYPHRPYSD